MRIHTLLVWFLTLLCCVRAECVGGVIRLEAEKAQLVGVQAAKDQPGYSGDGYVTGFDAAGDKVVFTFSAKAGIYELSIGYSTPNGEKGYEITVNSSKVSGMLPAIGKAFARPVGRQGRTRRTARTRYAVEKGWGWWDLDYIELTPAKASPKPKKVPKKLADPDATPAAKALMGYLIDQYGSRNALRPVRSVRSHRSRLHSQDHGQDPGDSRRRPHGLLTLPKGSRRRSQGPRGADDQGRPQGVHHHDVLALECPKGPLGHRKGAVVERLLYPKHHI